MAYTINKTNGAVLTTVADGTIDNTSDLTLIGKNYSGYGEILNENFVKLMENFASSSQPASPLAGQLWWDLANNSLKVYTGSGFKIISGSTASATQPSSATLGDLWFDTTNNQLHAYNGGWQLIGPPSTTSAGGTSGAIVETILDSSSNDHVVVKLYIENTVVGIFSSSSAFTPQTSINGYSIIYPGFNLAGTTAVASAQLTGDASNALKLNGVGSNQFLRADQPASTPYSLGVGNLVVSTALVLNQITSTTEVAVQSLLNGYNLNFYSNIGTLTRAIGISGADASVTVDNDLSVTGTLGVTGATTLSGTTTLVDITTLQNKIVPSADGTIDIGASATKFAAVYATTFNGSLNGNVTASAVTVGNVAIGVNSITLSGNTMATQAFVSGYVQTAGQNSQGAKTVSTSAPSGTATVGDIWYQI